MQELPFYSWLYPRQDTLTYLAESGWYLCCVDDKYYCSKLS
jgi:hypothetical protein